MDVAIVVPREEDLEIDSDGSVCTVEGCGRVFKTSSQLHMHITKHHRGKPLAHKVESRVYCCPVETCGRSKNEGGKPFPRLGQLKQVGTVGYVILVPVGLV